MYNYEIENIKEMLTRKIQLKDYKFNELEIKKLFEMTNDYLFLTKKYEVIKELYLLK